MIITWGSLADSKNLKWVFQLFVTVSESIFVYGGNKRYLCHISITLKCAIRKDGNL